MKKGKLWIISRVGILIAFGIIPLATLPMKIRQHNSLDHLEKFYSANSNFWSCNSEFYACLSSNDFQGCDFWQNKMHQWQTNMDAELEAANKK